MSGDRARVLRAPTGADPAPKDTLRASNVASNAGIYTVGTLAALGLSKFGKVALRMTDAGEIEVLHPEAWDFDEEKQRQALKDSEETRLAYEESLDALSESEAIQYLTDEGLTDDEIATYLEGRDERRDDA